ncbi:hypothetical protein GDO78_016577 [Eleutherodactylus coqui]|uniref:KRAB domain-containing protein n=1 Tax=Eleutherodactylus coqui TaxID=57060 RepID=A0A8J6C8E8_ELECQ|nr:hypothetical protein GDO78_016577 [Eleutherodactylus coqui]
MDPPPHSQIPKRSCVQKIIELTNKIIELLTGEVPVRCQDVTVHFSMDEWKYLEGHKDQYKDTMMEDEQRHKSLDESSKRNPERHSSSPQSQDCLEGNPSVLQDNQVEDLIDIKVEVIEEEEIYARGDQQRKKEEIPVNISPGE